MFSKALPWLKVYSRYAISVALTFFSFYAAIDGLKRGAFTGRHGRLIQFAEEPLWFSVLLVGLLMWGTFFAWVLAKTPDLIRMRRTQLQQQLGGPKFKQPEFASSARSEP